MSSIMSLLGWEQTINENIEAIKKGMNAVDGIKLESLHTIDCLKWMRDNKWLVDKGPTAAADLRAALKEAQTLAAAKQVWIDVQDELPPKEGNFLACNTHQGGLMFVAWFHKVHSTWKYTGGELCGYSYEKPQFTHWMPLPDKAAAESGGGK